MKIRYWLLAMSFIFLSCGRVADDVATNYGIIPMPNELAPMQGVYVLQGEKTVAVPSGEAAMKVFHYLEDALKNTSVTLKGISETGKADICLSIDNSLPDEAYTLEVSSDRINISSNETAAGFFMVSSLCCNSCRQPFMMVTGNTRKRLGFLLSALRMLPVFLIVGL